MNRVLADHKEFRRIIYQTDAVFRRIDAETAEIIREIEQRDRESVRNERDAENVKFSLNAGVFYFLTLP